MTPQAWAWIAAGILTIVHLLAAALSAALQHEASQRPRNGDVPSPLNGNRTDASDSARTVGFISALGLAFAVAYGTAKADGEWWLVPAALAGLAVLLFATQLSMNLLAPGTPPMRALKGIAAQALALAGKLSPARMKKRFWMVESSAVQVPDRGLPASLAEDLERLGQAGGEVSGELRMIKAVLSMDTARVREIMRPRVDMVAARVDSTPDQLVELIKDRGHSKIPVHGETIDEIVGIVYARDLLRLANGQGSASVRDVLRPAIFVPESQRLEQLLREFQRHRTQIAIVVDEYGGVSGLVTVQDLIEEIVGEIVDEFDANEPDFERVSESEAVMDARMPIDSFNEMFGVSVASDGFDTVGGLVYRELGKMPVVGDTVNVQSIRIAVESTMGRRIRRLRVKRVEEASDTAV